MTTPMPPSMSAAAAAITVGSSHPRRRSCGTVALVGADRDGAAIDGAGWSAVAANWGGRAAVRRFGGGARRLQGALGAPA